jgi:hypothetical protein
MAKCLYNCSLKCTLSAHRSNFVLLLLLLLMVVVVVVVVVAVVVVVVVVANSLHRLVVSHPKTPLLCLVRKLHMLFIRTFFGPFSFLAACMRVSTTEPFYRFSQLF